MSKVLVNFIQDRSGSMSVVWDETLNGFKSFVDELKKGEKDDEYLFTLTVFDTQINTPIIAEPIAKVDPDALRQHGPRGSTALYDAAGVTIKKTEENSHGADKIIVVICTDGHENSSREWTKDALHTAIDKHLNEGNWTFTYLGTQPETWDDAYAIGVSAGSSANYVGQNAGATYTVMAQAVNSLAKSSLRGSRSIVSDFSDRAQRMSIGMKLSTDDDAAGTPTPTKPTSSKNWRKGPLDNTKNKVNNQSKEKVTRKWK